MPNQVDPISFLLKNQPPGTAVWGYVSAQRGEALRPAILGRLESKEGQRIPKSPIVVHRATCIVQNNVGLIAWMCRIDDRDEWTFETWINVHATNWGERNPLSYLKEQAHLDVLLFENGTRPIRAFRVENRLDWETIERQIPNKTWSMQEFNQAREKVYIKYPDMFDLWQATGETL